MSLIKEFREFFLRSVSTNVGFKKDKEVGYPTTHILDGKVKFNRFLKTHIPTEGIMSKFLNSITFKYNVEDTATETEHGLSKLTTNTQYSSGTDNDVDGYSLNVKPSQVKASIDSLNLAIANVITSGTGNFTYTEENYVVNNETLTQSVNALDVQMKLVVPVGGIIMWGGSVVTLPTGWVLCDGTGGTPNLSGQFIVGYSSVDSDYDTIGNTGGSKEVILTVPQLPPHDHILTQNAAGGVLVGDPADARLRNDELIDKSASVDGYTGLTEETGDGTAHENRPPYYVLAYIQKL